MGAPVSLNELLESTLGQREISRRDCRLGLRQRRGCALRLLLVRLPIEPKAAGNQQKTDGAKHELPRMKLEPIYERIDAFFDVRASLRGHVIP
jgi:hypothetical protein